MNDSTNTTIGVDCMGCLVVHVSSNAMSARIELGREHSMRIARQILAHDIVQSLTVEQLESSAPS